MVSDVLIGAVAAADTYRPMSRVTLPAADMGSGPLIYNESAVLAELRMPVE